LPNTFSPVESITTVTGPSVLDSAAATSRSALRREKVVWSGTGSVRPSRHISEPSKPSVCRHGRPKAKRNISPASMAMSE